MTVRSSLPYSSEWTKTELTVAKKFQTRLSNPNLVKQKVFNPIQIHHKFENPPDLNPNPCSFLALATKSSVAHLVYR